VAGTRNGNAAKTLAADGKKREEDDETWAEKGRESEGAMCEVGA
jgi:hypothetical protein